MPILQAVSEKDGPKFPWFGDCVAPTLEIRETSRLSFGRALVASLSIFHHCSGFYSFAADFCSHPTKSAIVQLAMASLVGNSAGRWSFGRSKKYLVPVAQAAHLSLNFYFIRLDFFLIEPLLVPFLVLQTS